MSRKWKYKTHFPSAESLLLVHNYASVSTITTNIHCLLS
jgi:hypothetical protein